MSDERPDEGAPRDPRPSGRIRIVGAQPATGEQPIVSAGRPPEDDERETPAAEPPPAEDPNRFGAVPIIGADDPPPEDEPPVAPPPAQQPPAEEPHAAPVGDTGLRPAPDVDDLDLPDTQAVPVVPGADDEEDDIRVWAAPAEDEEETPIEAGRSATDEGYADLAEPALDDDNPFADLVGGEEELPHWADPPSDEVEAVEGLASGPRWRGQGHESGEPEDFSDLLDETRVEPGGENEMIFDDIDAGVTDPVEPSSGAPQRRQPYPDAPVDEHDDVYARGGGGGGGGGGRDMQQAVVVGAGLVVLLLVCALIGPAALVLLATVVVVMATAEFFTATRRAGYHPAPLVGLAGSGGLVLATYWRGEGAFPLVLFLVVVTALCWWLFDAGPGDHAVPNVGITVFGVAYVGVLGAFAALLLKFPDGVGMLIGAILVTVAADVGGLFIGQRFGSSPLTQASPNKTVEGFFGGIVAAGVVGVIVGMALFPWEPLDGLVLGIVGGVLSPLGDLCESRLKRDLGLKDMGTLLPGHGGVLDRFDGLLFVLPATYYVVRLLEVYANTP